MRISSHEQPGGFGAVVAIAAVDTPHCRALSAIDKPCSFTNKWASTERSFETVGRRLPLCKASEPIDLFLQVFVINWRAFFSMSDANSRYFRSNSTCPVTSSTNLPLPRIRSSEACRPPIRLSAFTSDQPPADRIKPPPT